MSASSRIAPAACVCALVIFTCLLAQDSPSAQGAVPNGLPLKPIVGTSQPATNLPASAADWPMYGHDVSRTSYNAAETTISASNIGQLVSRWQGYVGISEFPSSSSPAVSNGRVFVGSSASTGNNFFAFNSVTGSPLWGANLGYVGDCALVGIGSSPVVSGTVVSVGGGDRAYYGLNAVSGQILYRNDMNVGESGFAWTSPLMAYGRTYIGMASNCDAPSVRGELRALDMQSGQQQVNRYFVPAGQRGGGIWQSPALSPDGSTLVVCTGEDYAEDNGPYNRAIVSLNPITLQVLQANQQGDLNQDLDFGSTPVFFSDSQGRVLVGANHKDDVFYAYEANNIAAGPIWQLPIGTDVGTMPSYDPTRGNGGTLFIAGQTGVDSTVYAVDPSNGAIRWGPVPLAEFHGNMAVANGLIFINAGRDGVRVLDESTGAILRTILPNQVGRAFSGIAVANGFIYWLSGAYLNAWSLPNYVPPTDTPTPTVTPPVPTPTPVLQSLLVGHVTWQGRTAQPNPLQQLPITLTLSAAGVGSFNYGPATTDSLGFFTTTISGLPTATYTWRAKGPKFLSGSGIVLLSGSPQTGLEMGTMLAGDANNDNVVNLTDFNILRTTFSLACGNTGYDDRADFTGDCLVNVFDFNLLRNNFGHAGTSPGAP